MEDLVKGFLVHLSPLAGNYIKWIALSTSGIFMGAYL
jgi:hypothetical protein